MVRRRSIIAQQLALKPDVLDEVKIMVQEVILHIGMHKTGSSSIQDSLNGYDDGNVRYAHFDTPNHSLTISTIFSKNPRRMVEHENSGRGEQEVNALKEKYTAQLDGELQSPVKTLIISGENIALLRPEAIESLSDHLANAGVKTTVIAYVRPPVGFASSAFQQRLKSQDSRVADLSQPTAIPWPEYRNRFEKFIDAFGAENVRFVKFSKDVIQGSVVDHFCRLVDIPEGKVTDMQVNESLPLEAVGLIYDFNQHGPVSRGAPYLVTARINLNRTLRKMFDTRFQIPVNLITSSWDLSDIEWMEKVGGFDLRPTESELKTSELDTSVGGTLEEYVTPISGGTMRILKKQLSKRGIRFLPEDKAVHLVTRLYYFFLIKAGQKK